MVTVKVGRLPGRIEEVVLDDGACRVADALGVAGLNPRGYEVRVNGELASVDKVLRDGDTTLLVRKISGNAGAGFIMVKVGRLPGRIVEIALDGGKKVSDALEGARLDPSGYEIRVNGSPAGLDSDLRDGDVVLLVRKISGN